MMSHNSNMGPIISDGATLGRILPQSNNHLNIGHVNCQSINPRSQYAKMDELREFLTNSNIHVMGLSETWLKPDMSDESVHVPDYRLCRNDRPYPTRGGGVGLFVSNKIKYRHVFSSSAYNLCEAILIEINSHGTSFLIGVVYLPSGDLEAMEDTLGVIFSQYENILIMGDFNCNLFDQVKASNFRSACRRLGLSYIHNSMPTHWDICHDTTSLIDFFLVGGQNNISVSGQASLPFLQSYHALIYISLPFTTSKKDSYIEYRKFDDVDINIIRSHVDQFNFSSFYNNSCVNYKLNILNMLLTELYQLVPIIRFRVRRNKDPWMRIREVIVARSLRNRAYRVFRDSGMEDDRIIYCRLRNKLKSLIRKYRRLHYIKIFDGADSKKVWKILNNAGYGNRNLSINSEIDVNALNRSFVVNNNNNTNAFDFESLSGLTDGFSFKHIYSDELLYALSKVKSNSIGTDGFPIRFIKLVFPCIIQPVLHLFNMVITTSTYPNQWKLSRVVPVPKSNSNSDFRPISILPALSKVMEHVLKAQLLNYIYQNNLISDVQYAYKTGHNTTGMLLGITETIRDYLNRDMNCVMVSLDLSKAFDRLDHSVLICKLREKFKLSVMACKLFNSYLQGRSQYVGVQDIYSDIVDITCGVPQGSIIGPILFLLYMNDCIDCFDLDLVRPFIFADDIQLLFGCTREFPDVLEAVIKCALDKLLVWMGQNFFVINADKTKAIMFRTARRDYTYP
ncbi:RNA-directed DNA polymerase from mobile element jockey [Lucilia cuprina]|nr:RNA-directed DNA polymerase from mobile element jockey [Lucilia cuprina]